MYVMCMVILAAFFGLTSQINIKFCFYSKFERSPILFSELFHLTHVFGHRFPYFRANLAFIAVFRLFLDGSDGSIQTFINVNKYG